MRSRREEQPLQLRAERERQDHADAPRGEPGVLGVIEHQAAARAQFVDEQGLAPQAQRPHELAALVEGQGLLARQEQALALGIGHGRHQRRDVQTFAQALLEAGKEAAAVGEGGRAGVEFVEDLA
jgi:hypothetical protein